ncbi:MAG: hypothetical protein LBT08_07745 [Synergistaceae bacterium]|jgi:hypothetical protein|nr:hypothetical protein [Synergistaceae bacterium]
MAFESGNENQKSRESEGESLSGRAPGRFGRVITKNILGASGSKPQIEIVDTGTVSPVDTILRDILRKLGTMRNIAAKAASLPMDSAELASMQEEMNKQRDEIDALSKMVAMVVPPDKMGEEYDTILQVGDMVGGLLKKAVDSDLRASRASPEDASTDDEKITAWMQSLMKGWGMGRSV